MNEWMEEQKMELSNECINLFLFSFVQRYLVEFMKNSKEIVRYFFSSLV